MPWPARARPAGPATTPRTCCWPTSDARWRTGPEPEYIAFWYTRAQGLDRFDDWERIFRSGVAEQFEEPFRLAARIERGGSYDALLEPVPVDTERCYLEFFDFAGGAGRDEVCAAYEERAGSHGDLKLNVLLDRIGRLGARSARHRGLGPALVGRAGGDRPRPRRRRRPGAPGRRRACTPSSARRRFERPHGGKGRARDRRGHRHRARDLRAPGRGGGRGGGDLPHRRARRGNLRRRRARRRRRVRSASSSTWPTARPSTRPASRRRTGTGASTCW